MITYSVSVDRIHVILPLATGEDTHGLLECMWGFKGVPGCKVWDNEKQCYTTASISLSGGHTFRVHVGVSHKKVYCKFDFKPAALDMESWELLGIHLSYMLPHGYASLYYHGQVSYLEIAIDCTGVEWPGLLPFDSQLKNSTWYPPPPAIKPTAYLGRRGSNRVIRVYDRVEKLKTKGITIEGPVTRIEASLRRLKCTVPELELVQNPFATVGICRFADAEATLNLPSWQKFLNRCKVKGAPIALTFAGPLRQPFLQKLQSLNCEWWEPSKLWGGYMEALSVLKLPIPQNL